MRWSLFCCLLLASTALARPRSKRSISHIKSLISNKIFGVGTKTVTIAQPILSNNDTYQLFSIPGINDFLIKVTRNKKHEKDEKEKPKPVPSATIVKPEVAIVGSYLGTTTQKETLLAIDMVRNLVGSGILTGSLDGLIHELLIPQPPIYVEEAIIEQPLPVIAKDQGHILVPEYPHLFVPPELILTNPDAKYHYKQTGPDADMTYESFDSKDVLVTRTEKLPPLSEYLQLKVSDAAKNGASLSQPLKINGPSASYYANQAGSIRGPTQNSYHTYSDNQGMSGYLTGKEKNPYLSTYANQDLVSGHVAGIEKNPYLSTYANQDLVSGHVAGIEKNPYLSTYANQDLVSGHVAGIEKNPYLSTYANQDLVSGHVAGIEKNPYLSTYANQDLLSGHVAGIEKNPYLSTYANQDLVSGHVAGIEKNPYLSTYANQDLVSGHVAGIEKNPYLSTYANQDLVSGHVAGIEKNPYLSTYANQDLVSGHVAGVEKNPYLSTYANQDLVSGHVAGIEKNPYLSTYANQDLVSGHVAGDEKNPYLSTYANQDLVSGHVAGIEKNPYLSTLVNQGMIYENVPGKLGIAPLLNNINSDMMTGHVPEKWQNPPTPYNSNQGSTTSGNVAGKEQSPPTMNNVNQGITTVYVLGNGQNTPTTNHNNHGMTSAENLPGIKPNPAYSVNQNTSLVNMPGKGQNLQPISNGLTLGIIPEQGQHFHHTFNDNQGMTTGKFPGKGQTPPSIYNAWTLGHLPGNAPIPPPFNVNQGMLSGYLSVVGHNPSYALYNGMSGNLPEYTQSWPPIFNLNHGVIYGNVPGQLENAPPMSSFNSGMITGSVFGQLHHQGVMPGNIPGQEQHSSLVNNVNQGMTLEYAPGKEQNLPFTYSQGMSSGNVPGNGQYYQGMTSGNLSGTGHRPASYNFIQGAPVNNPTYYVNSGIVGQIPGHSSPGGQPYIGNNAGLIMTDRDPTLYPGPVSTVVSPNNFGNGHRVIVCKKKRLGKPCTHNTTPNLSKIETKSVVTQSNDAFGKDQNTLESEVLNNNSVNGKTKSQYSYTQINHHSNKNFTEVKVGESTVINTNKNINKDFLYIPPEDVSALSLQNEKGNGRGDTEDISSNLRTSEGNKKQNMTSNRVKTNLSQHPIVVLKRSNSDDKETEAADLDEGEKKGNFDKEDIPGSTF